MNSGWNSVMPGRAFTTKNHFLLLKGDVKSKKKCGIREQQEGCGQQQRQQRPNLKSNFAMSFRIHFLSKTRTERVNFEEERKNPFEN